MEARDAAPESPLLSELAEMEQRVIDGMLNHEPPLLRAADVHAFRALLHPHTMRVAREVFFTGVEWGMMQPDRRDEELVRKRAREAFPLPPRRVLREEPDPLYGASILWRWRGGVLEIRRPSSPVNTSWCSLMESGQSYPPLPDRITLWADLLANPYREEPQ